MPNGKCFPSFSVTTCRALLIALRRLDPVNKTSMSLCIALMQDSGNMDVSDTISFQAALKAANSKGPQLTSAAELWLW